MRPVWFSLFYLLLAWALGAQTPADKIRERMEASLERQRAAVRKQAQKALKVEFAEPQAEPFYLIPWPDPPPAVATASPAAFGKLAQTTEPGAAGKGRVSGELEGRAGPVWASEAPIASGAPCPPVPGEELDALVRENAERQGLPERLVRAVIQRESAGRPCAVSSAGAQGLMQLMPATADHLRVRNPFDPRENIEGGTRYLKQLLDRFDGDLALALSAYNAGPGRVEAAGKTVPNIPETQQYVDKIMKSLRVE